uniref:Lipase domain-containing protein n=1 Tax=Anopheles atroparvus TaxID=41427 RepID=A0AAG5DLS3_ANOAO
MKHIKRFEADSGSKFLLWTERTKMGEHEELKFNDPGALGNSTFNPRHPTRILIHGWLSDWTSDAVEGLAKAYVTRGSYNVIGVDWSAGAGTLFYPLARVRVTDVAKNLAKQISLFLRAGQQPSQIVLIGHSLGAHIAGLTGKHFQTRPKLAAVVALDPAGPLFDGTDPSGRVDRLDAEYVEVIHTNMGWLGHQDTLGQADFFPNGGHSQTGCTTNSCDHQRAIEYYRKSLESETPLYIGRRCETECANDKCDGVPAVMASDPDDKFKVKRSGMFYLSITDKDFV